MGAIAGWTLVNLVEKSLVRYEWRRFVSTLVYVFIVATPAAWLAFAVRLGRPERGLSRRSLLLLLIEPAIVLALVSTDVWHGLFRAGIIIQDDGPYAVTVARYGPLFWLHAAYTYALFFTGAVLAIRGLARQPDWSPTRVAILLSGMAVPTLGNVAYVFRWQPEQWGDLTPVYFAVTGMAAAWMLFKVRIFDIRPIACDAILDSLHDAVLVLDDQGRILDANPAARALLPSSSSRMLLLAEVFPELAQCLKAAPSSAAGTELRLPLAGKGVWDMQHRPIIDRGVRIGTLLRLSDATARKQAEAEHAQLLAREQEARAQAESLLVRAGEADRRKNVFLAMLGHELRNPLAPIRNAVHLLEGAVGAGGPADVARKVLDRQVRHLSELVDDLLDVSRIAHSKITLDKKRCDLVEIVRTAADDRRPIIETASLTFVMELTAGPVWVQADSVRLVQVLDNLLTNAAKFTDPGGRVTLTLAVEIDQQRAVIMVEDTGIGIDTVLLPHLFEAFSQGEHGVNPSRGGLGLGLALVRGLVRLHGGEVTASSAGPGQGAVFTWWIPLEPHTGSSGVSATPVEPEHFSGVLSLGEGPASPPP
jgi:signal transduction histidine kinase